MEQKAAWVLLLGGAGGEESLIEFRLRCTGLKRNIGNAFSLALWTKACSPLRGGGCSSISPVGEGRRTDRRM